MGLNYPGLDEATRTLMLEEIEFDIGNHQLYLSPRLTAFGRAGYPELLKSAALLGNDETLGGQLRLSGFLQHTESRRTRSGGTTNAAVPWNAHETLAEGEFNRFYCRAVCRRAIASGQQTHVQVFRAKAVQSPRLESLALEGREILAEVLLDDLRKNIGVDTALGIPAGPNSGLSVRLSEIAAA